MPRSSVGKIAASVALLTVSFNTLSQSIDEPLAAIADNSDEPSGWMHIEVAIFVDSSSTALASELWAVEPSLSYPPNKRWLTDYNEIKTLMDQWGEEAVKIDPNGSIVIAPVPAPAPATESMLVNASDAEQSLVGDAIEPLFNAASDFEPTIDGAMGVTLVDDAAGGSDSDFQPADTLPSAQPETAKYASLKDRIGAESLTNSVAEMPQLGSQTSDESPEDDSVERTGQIPLENLATLSGNENIGSFSPNEIPDPATAVADPMNRRPLSDERGADALSGIDSSEGLTVPNTEIDEAGIEIAENGRNETSDESENFFAIDGLGEDFSGLSSGDETALPGLEDSAEGGGIDWLSDFETEEPSDSEALAGDPTPPPLPASYQLMPYEILKPGLRKLEKDTGRAPVSVLSWLQPISAESDAVVVDKWTQSDREPHIQGTLQINGPSASSREYRLATNLWTNTTGSYLPQKLPPLALPAPPTRVLLIEPEQVITQVLEEPTVEFIDITTGLNTLRPEPIDTVTTEDEDPVVAALPKHAIALMDQRDLREGYVRYIDHPVIQVAAVWRELTYAELFELGEAQRVRRDIDSLTRGLINTESAPQKPSTAEREPAQITR
ncbi:hypothetical protein E0F26_08600 [Candidatus Paraluminiphilus aquimaris]|uniref:DUF1559 domain-containing protein n=1 Tax=Candidatus Paraluminiphilus aquimaris TaxID=2518994 RepID=A0ABY6Q994_9GAMM|nr:hypothetical protein [Candidatus Paraluminiphilus aquimaris]UZP74791.1 hypothetical protein E0F26_08600 [Candidatus Paraluminiphilus aquimaris]